ncbi:ATP-dependent (S)-NAD(P)H-hydrate dehydratase-like isoform X2 [Amphibalanus amphitrite]|nr:ATP-dependent (S)-NAD(P)H-hydrate dehydratase-like isoform X2 [Amphibalanus amphitrite]XP_043209301.1 ATP-dependent (S)-NAD(P)H-hydrate dehydratase-like isoform X2 [Amphibalanus amphitrite]XP_043209302.1 ATP-dependent (S)-NAD(P)H-hydrate dehydratase-like isoform X2 [Amphibalanus amphitrite]
MAGAGELLRSLRAVVPRLRAQQHKGQAGRVGVLGGSAEYTGAPYFAAITAMRTGADLAHVFCPRDAAAAIKAYGPDVIVHPVLDAPDAVAQIREWAPRLCSLVVGPGLGRDRRTLDTVQRLVEALRPLELPMVFDADALWLVAQAPDLVRGYHSAVLTPNAAEFGRLYKAVLHEELAVAHYGEQHVRALSRELGDVAIVRKGRDDAVVCGDTALWCSEPGSLRRCGGQGDLLAGALATLLHWTKTTNQPLAVDARLLAAYGACALTRRASRLAFERHGRSMLASDMLQHVHTAFEQLFEDRVGG